MNTLKSNNAPINVLVFSPGNDSSLVLASVSDQICFWNISYVVNNPMEDCKLRRSQRFDRKASVRLIEKLQESPTNGNGHNHIHTTPWMGKLGPTEKPELLACIQVIGNSAEQMFTNKSFTHFVTIDDEGEVYNLKIFSEIYNDRNGNI